MENLLGVRLEGQPPLHMVRDPDNPVPITCAQPQPRRHIWSLRVSMCLRVIFFSSVGLMHGQEEKVCEHVASS